MNASDQIVTLALPLFVAYLIWRWLLGRTMKQRIQSTQTAEERYSSALALLPAEHFLSEEERLAQRAAEVREHWDEQLADIEEEHDEKMAAIRERLEKGHQLVESSGVGVSLCQVIRHMWHWPSWSQLDDWQMPVFVEDIAGGEIDGTERSLQNGKWLSWSMNGRSWRVELKPDENYAGDYDTKTADLILFVDSDKVLHLNVSQNIRNEYDHWDFFGVSALKAGDWMIQLNELAGRLRIADGEWGRQHELDFYGRRSNDIEID